MPFICPSSRCIPCPNYLPYFCCSRCCSCCCSRQSTRILKKRTSEFIALPNVGGSNGSDDDKYAGRGRKNLYKSKKIRRGRKGEGGKVENSRRRKNVDDETEDYEAGGKRGGKKGGIAREKGGGKGGKKKVGNVDSKRNGKGAGKRDKTGKTGKKRKRESGDDVGDNEGGGRDGGRGGKGKGKGKGGIGGGNGGDESGGRGGGKGKKAENEGFGRTKRKKEDKGYGISNEGVTKNKGGKIVGEESSTKQQKITSEYSHENLASGDGSKAANECFPNQKIKCPQVCTERTKRCNSTQMKPCYDFCTGGKSSSSVKKCSSQQTLPCKESCGKTALNESPLFNKNYSNEGRTYCPMMGAVPNLSQPLLNAVNQHLLLQAKQMEIYAHQCAQYRTSLEKLYCQPKYSTLLCSPSQKKNDICIPTAFSHQQFTMKPNKSEMPFNSSAQQLVQCKTCGRMRSLSLTVKK